MQESSTGRELLFWFYKEFDVCLDRVRRLRQLHPGASIYGLYGGTPDEEGLFREKIGPLLDDFYSSPDLPESYKWIHGEALLLDWYRNRGQMLPWTSLIIAQWDLLPFLDLRVIFSEVAQDAMYLPGLRKLSPAVESQWCWTSTDEPHCRGEYLKFREHLSSLGASTEDLLACLFPVGVIPRIFFHRFDLQPWPELGFLEYKLPTLAALYGIPLANLDIGISWGLDGEPSPLLGPVHTKKTPISSAFIRHQLRDPEGWRLFHPYYKAWRE